MSIPAPCAPTDVTPGSQLKKITKPIGYGLLNTPQKSSRFDPLLKNLIALIEEFRKN